jgi:hypothetical protein
VWLTNNDKKISYPERVYTCEIPRSVFAYYSGWDRPIACSDDSAIVLVDIHRLEAA